MAVFPVTASDTGVSVTDSATIRATRKPADTGATVTGSIAKTSGRFITGTGATVTDATRIVAARQLTDTGATVTDSAFGGHGLVDQGFGGFANRPVSDDFNRANENPLSGGGNWTRVGSTPLALVSNAVVGTVAGGVSSESFSGAGVFIDCDVWVTLTGTPSFSRYAGVIARQRATGFVIATGQACYMVISIPGANEIVLQYVNVGGGVTTLGTWPITTSPGDSVGIRCVGPKISAYYRPAGGSWQLLGTVTDTNEGQGYAGLTTNDTTFSMDGFGVALPGGTDTIRPFAPRLLTDTGLNFSDGGISFPIHDVGLTLTTTLATSRLRLLSTVGLPRVDDSLGQVSLTDTGLSVSDSLAARRIVPRGPTDTGTTFGDSMLKVARKVIADTGVALLDTLVARTNGHNTSVTISERGLTVSGSIAKQAVLFRPIPVYAPDTGLNISDGISLAVYTTTITPTIVDGTVVFVVTVTRRSSSGRIKANFTYSVSGLSVVFHDTSTPGPSGPITDWFWTFGDGATSTAQNPSHTYAGSNTYTVTLTVTGTDPDGLDSVSKAVTVFVPAVAGFHLDLVTV